MGHSWVLPGAMTFGCPGVVENQWSALFKHTPVPGTTTPLPNPWPRLWVMFTGRVAGVPVRVQAGRPGRLRDKADVLWAQVVCRPQVEAREDVEGLEDLDRAGRGRRGVHGDPPLRVRSGSTHRREPGYALRSARVRRPPRSAMRRSM